MDKITQEAYFRQRVLKYAAEHGVTAYRLSRKTVHKWKKRYDGTLESLKDRPRTPHHFPKQQKEDLLTKVKQKFQFLGAVKKATQIQAAVHLKIETAANQKVSCRGISRGPRNPSRLSQKRSRCAGTCWQRPSCRHGRACPQNVSCS